jgi:hypothetical protein
MDNERRATVYKVVICYFIVVFAAMMWPIYPYFSRIRPMDEAHVRQFMEE